MKTIEQYFHVVLFDMLYRVPDETFFQIAIIFFSVPVETICWTL